MFSKPKSALPGTENTSRGLNGYEKLNQLSFRHLRVRDVDGTPYALRGVDACIAIYNMAHCGTRNERGTESRKNMIFRLRNKKRQPDKLVNGISDHPDRGQRGEWLEYEEGNNPWEQSKRAMCNMWEEWDGMEDVVAEQQAK